MEVYADQLARAAATGHPERMRLLLAAESAALAGIRFVSEGFADRAYTATGGLAARDTPGAVLDADMALAQA
ncbi:LamB/YcsF family protein, partial [Nocardia carnea]|uniref:LamB/YcsF family protein n=1 Tax=Nocardia carnea TaxID=37328 RepID=UPI003D76CFEE